MAYAFVQTSTRGNDVTATTAATVSTAANVSSGNLLFGYTSYDNATAVGVTWSNTVTSGGFARISSTFSSTFSIGEEWAYWKNTSSGPCSIKATYSGTVNFNNILVAEYSGFDTTAPFTAGETANSTFVSLTGTDADQSGSTATLSQQPAGAISVLYDDTSRNSTVAGTGYTKRLDITTVGGDGLWMEDKRFTALNAVAGTWTTTTATHHLNVMVAVFREAGATTAANAPVEFYGMGLMGLT